MPLEIEHLYAVIAGAQVDAGVFAVGAMHAVMVDDLLAVDVQVRAVVREQPKSILTGAAHVENPLVVDGEPLEPIVDARKSRGEVARGDVEFVGVERRHRFTGFHVGEALRFFGDEASHPP